MWRAFKSYGRGLPWWFSGLEFAFSTGDMGSVPGQDTMIPHAMGQLSPHATVKSLHSQKKQKQNNNKKRTVVQGNGRHPCLLIGFTEAKKKKLSHILRLDCFTTWSKVTIAVGIFYFFLFFFYL